MMKDKEINSLLKKINEVKIAVYGDFCLDAYWILDPRGSEISVLSGGSWSRKMSPDVKSRSRTI